MADEGKVDLSITDEGGIAVIVTLPEEYLFNKPLDMVRYELYRRFEYATPYALQLINQVRSNPQVDLEKPKEAKEEKPKAKPKSKTTKKK